ncbi:MAG: hypothetical protein COB39_11730 [Marinosulfonomonas sp.]|nr:MAG: hypothetical protein COB39_11730 [Marinosulfonomonas sp.]
MLGCAGFLCGNLAGYCTYSSDGECIAIQFFQVWMGAALIERAARDPETAILLTSLIKGLKRQQDRKAFEDWQPSVPPQIASPQKDRR